MKQSFLCLFSIILTSVGFYIPIYRNNFNSNIKICLELSVLQDMERKSLDCVNISKLKYTNGSEYYSNPKSQMGSWIDENIKNDMLQIFSSLQIDTSSRTFKKLLQLSNQSFSVDIFHNNCEYSLTLFHIQPNSHISKYSHEAGTVLAYKLVYGRAILNTIFNQRLNRQDVLNDAIINRIGGPVREIVNNSTLPSGVLELAIYPPIVKLERTFNTEATSSYIGQSNASAFNLLRQNYITLDDPEVLVYAVALKEDEKSDLFKRQEVVSKSNESLKKQDFKSSLPLQSIISSKYSSIDVLTDIPLKLSSSIGGLDNQLKEIVRRLLLSRQLPSDLMYALGLTHVTGLLLYGPPGTGKTLIARELSALLTSRPVQIVNGPELLDKYVGEAERNIRQLFKAADDEWEEAGQRSALHVIIFDEFDSIAKKRGMLAGDGSGVRDSVVNQLLSALDGVRTRNNVLVIALTNRKDLIDPALLRPGRLEVQIYIPPPDRRGREEILKILFIPLIERGLLRLERATRLVEDLGAVTHGWTGADLTGLLRSAVSHWTVRYFDALPSQMTTDEQSELAEIADSDFVRALDECRRDKYSIPRHMRLLNFLQRRIYGIKLK